MFFGLFCNDDEETKKESAFLELETTDSDDSELHLSTLPRNTPKHLQDMNQPKKNEDAGDDNKSLDVDELFDSTATLQPSPVSLGAEQQPPQQVVVVSQKEPFVDETEEGEDAWIPLKPSTYGELEKFLDHATTKEKKNDSKQGEEETELQQQMRIIEKENAWYEHRQAKKNKKKKQNNATSFGGGKGTNTNKKKKQRNRNTNMKKTIKAKGLTVIVPKNNNTRKPLGARKNASNNKYAKAAPVAVATV